jgi:mannose-6-phosphate isomerase-like protein (cupin superfamily)
MLLGGCATQRSTHYWFADGVIKREQIEDVLRRDALAPNENIRVSNLGVSASASHHIVQVRFAETLHIHKDHDLTAIIYRGQGKFRLGNEVIPLKQGDVVFVPQGVPHAFQNRAATPTAAIVVFTPAFDGHDTIPVTDQEPNAPK